jgi:predicted nucleic acid-binding protein
MVYLDSAIVIYFVEQPAAWGPKAAARLAALRAQNEPLAVSDLTRMECFVGPLKSNNQAALSDFVAFFQSPDVRVFPVTAAACDRAAAVRAVYGFKPLDALHLAVAVETGCTRFLTNDVRLSRFPDITVEVLT